MKYLIWAGVAAVAPATYGFLAWLSWWTPQVTP